MAIPEPMKIKYRGRDYYVDTHQMIETMRDRIVVCPPRDSPHSDLRSSVEIDALTQRNASIDMKRHHIEAAVVKLSDAIERKEREMETFKYPNFRVTSTTATATTTYSLDTINTMANYDYWGSSIDYQFLRNEQITKWQNTLVTNDPYRISLDDYQLEFVPHETEEERFTREWNEILEGKQSLNRKLIRNMASDRAKNLLLSTLTKEQLKRFEEDRCIPVDSEKGNSYIIRPAKSINIEVVGKHHKLCAGPDADVPLYDAMLAQKLMLENDEKAFLKVANVWRD
jgi:hypothetical protein